MGKMTFGKSKGPAKPRSTKARVLDAIPTVIEVPVEVPVEVIKEVIIERIVQLPGIETIKYVEVPVEKIVYADGPVREVIKTIEVPVIKEVKVETIREVEVERIVNQPQVSEITRIVRINQTPLAVKIALVVLSALSLYLLIT